MATNNPIWTVRAFGKDNELIWETKVRAYTLREAIAEALDQSPLDRIQGCPIARLRGAAARPDSRKAEGQP